LPERDSDLVFTDPYPKEADARLSQFNNGIYENPSAIRVRNPFCVPASPAQAATRAPLHPEADFLIRLTQPVPTDADRDGLIEAIEEPQHFVGGELAEMTVQQM
jgi:hypothetical protein